MGNDNSKRAPGAGFETAQFARVEACLIAQSWERNAAREGRTKTTHPQIIWRRMGPNAGPILGGSHLCQDPNQYPYIFNTECRANEEKSVDYQRIAIRTPKRSATLVISLVAN